MKKKLMAIILSVLFIVALFPVSAFATGESVLFLGDSITTGYGLGEGEKSYVDIMESDGYDIAVDAESGFTTQDILNNMEEYEFAIGATDFVVITIGGNDLMNTLYKFVVDKYNADPDNGGKTLTVEELKAALTGELDIMLLLSIASYIPQFKDSPEELVAIAQFKNNLGQIISSINSINPDAAVIVANQYNPYRKIDNAMVFDIVKTFEDGVLKMNYAISGISGNFEVLDVYSAFKDAAAPCTNAVFGGMGGENNLDFHPNALGHSLIAAGVENIISDYNGEGTPDFELSETLYDFGSIYDVPKSAEFTITNTGDTTLRNIEVYTNSVDPFFTISEDYDKTLAPGESTTFTVTMTWRDPGEESRFIWVTVHVRADHVESKEIGLTGDFEPLDTKYTVYDESGDLFGSFATLEEAFAVCHQGYSVYFKVDTVLTEQIPDGVTLYAYGDITITVNDASYIGNGEINIDYVKVIYNGQTIISPGDDGILKSDESEITWSKEGLTLVYGTAEIQEGKTFYLMTEDGEDKIPLNLYIERDGELVVNGTLKAVSGNVSDTGSVITVDGKMTVNGDLSLAQKAKIVVNEGGAVELSDVEATDLIGADGKSVLKGDIVLNYGSSFIYNGISVMDSASPVKLVSGKATLNLGNLDASNITSSYVDLEIEGNTEVTGVANAYFKINYMGTDINLPIHMTLKSGTTRIASGGTLNLMKGSEVPGFGALGSSSLKVESGAALNIMSGGAMEIQSGSAFVGTANVYGDVYIFDDNGLGSDAVFEIRSENGGVYAMKDSVSATINGGTMENGDYTYTSVTPGNSTQSTFTSKWSGDQTEDEPVFDVIDGEGAPVGSYGALKDAFEACRSGYTVLVGEDSELTEVVPDGVTVEVLLGYTLTVSDMANLGNGTVKFRVGADFVYKGSKIIGDFSDDEAIIQNSDCIFTLTKDRLTMSEGNKAWIRIPAGKTLDLGSLGVDLEIPESVVLTLDGALRTGDKALNVEDDGKIVLNDGGSFTGTANNNGDIFIINHNDLTNDLRIVLDTNGRLAVKDEVTSIKATIVNGELQQSGMTGFIPTEENPRVEVYFNTKWEYSEDGGVQEGDDEEEGPTRYILNFQTNGGSKIEVMSAVSGTTVDLTKYIPEREGYEFAGWYADESLTEKIDSVKMTGSKTVYAAWNPFKDIDSSEWYYDGAVYTYSHDLILGVETDEFGPLEKTTRGMFVTILYRLEGEPAVSGAPEFTDVDPDMYYADAIAWAAKNEIVLGNGDGTFGPEDSLTREQMAAILYRYAEYKGYDTSKRVDLDSKFTDAAMTSDWAVENLSWANAMGFIIGDSDTTINPQGSATRDIMATILMRFCKEYKVF